MRMKPFFPFFGSKYRLAKRYPAPQGEVVEPFAGSACYSTYWGVEKAVLIDADENIASVWDYLIRSTPDEIMGLPLLHQEGEGVAGLEAGAANLIGFWLTKGSVPVKKRGSYAASDQWRHLFWRESIRERIASQVDQIKGWTIRHGDYSEAPALEGATYFIDPPYQKAGKHYRVKFTAFSELSEWSQTLPGRVIVCEGEGADWLPFTSMGDFKTFATGSAPEKVWIK